MTREHEDEVIEEIRHRRQAHAEAFNYDLTRITNDLQRQERESGAPVVKRSPRKPQVVPKRSFGLSRDFRCWSPPGCEGKR